MPPFVSFLSDFGSTDEFVGVVHGVIARLAPEVRVIDVTHGIPPGNIRAGALALTRAIQYLPEGVVLAVVDPGVGTDRRAIAAQTPVGYFVGPDNGLLSPAVAMAGGASQIVSIENPDMAIPTVANTFDGRDRFAPAAALLATGEAQLSDLGPPIDATGVTPLLLPLPQVENGRVSGVAWWIDRFGNVQTNLSPEDLQSSGMAPGMTIRVTVGSMRYDMTWVEAFGDVEFGEPMVLVDSAGLMALSVRDGSAAQDLNLGEDTRLSLQAASS